MGGYTHSDAPSEHSLILNENAVNAVKEILLIQQSRPTQFFCRDCTEEIPLGRRKAVPGVQYCVQCAPSHQQPTRKIKMLTRIL